MIARDKYSEQDYRQGEAGYTWFFFARGKHQAGRVTVILLALVASIGVYVWGQVKGIDLAPDGIVGLCYGLGGLTCFLLALVMYTLRRRFRQHALGQLNRSLNWHTGCALLGVALLLMHSLGSLAAESGTYALFCLLALVGCGVLGRFLDRYLAWKIALAVESTLTLQGEDRAESLAREIAFSGGNGMYDSSWAQLRMASTIEDALAREQRYRQVIHAWRIVHIGLALLTAFFVGWHLLYVFQFFASM